MRGIRQDPCKGCGRTIEHDGEPFKVYCAGCALEAVKPKSSETFGPFCMNHEGFSGMSKDCPHCLKEKAKPVPPPTTEWRRAPKVVCKHCIFMMGMLAGAFLMLLLR